jgi:polar amino acid transport system substrate-binding protein
LIHTAPTTGSHRYRWVVGLRLAGLLGVALLSHAVAAADAVAPTAPLPTLVLVSTEDIARSQGNWLRRIYGEALRRVGYQLEYRNYPPRRASALLDSGAVDGTLHRSTIYGDSHPNLIRVPVSHYTSTFSAYGLAPLTLADGWQALAASGLRVECRAGVTPCETMTAKLVPAKRLSNAFSITLGLRKLQYRRTDVFVDVEHMIEVELAAPEFQHSGIHKVATMEVVDAYCYLQKRHGELVPKLARALADMKREGLIDRYRQQPSHLIRPPTP